MSLYFKWGAALAVCGAVLVASSAQAQSQVQRSYYEDSDLQSTFDEVLASYQCGCSDGGYYESGCGCGYDSGCCGGCCDSGCGCGGNCGCSGGGCMLGGGGGMCGSGCGQFYAGAEYIYARAKFSEAIAFVTNETQTGTPPITATRTHHEWDFQHNSNYGFYGGWRDCCCGTDIRFAFRRLGSDASFQSTDPGAVFPAELAVDTSPGSFVQGSADVDLQNYDLGCSKTIPLGGPLCCDCGDCCGCGDGCGCGDCCGAWCPAYDITYSAGLRYADVDWSTGYQQFEGALDAITRTYGQRMEFDGWGARFGLEGRRYFGRCGTISVFLKGDVSLLCGDVEITAERLDIPSQVLDREVYRVKNIIPVTEIEAGITGHLTRNITVSGGYFLSAWHDLGMRPDHEFNDAGGTPSSLAIDSFDDGNILGFDGFFARAEIAY